MKATRMNRFKTKSIIGRSHVTLLFLLFVSHWTRADDGQCVEDSECERRASNDECELFPEVMVTECPISCRNPCLCGDKDPPITTDTACDCLVKAKAGYCSDPSSKFDCEATCTSAATRECIALPGPEDQNAHLSTKDRTYLTVVTEQCNPGYAPQNDIDKGTKMCQSMGLWIDVPPNHNSIVCVPIDCGKPPAIVGGDVSYSETLAGNIARYDCHGGSFLPDGSTQVILVCQDNATWSGNQMECKKNCDQAPSPPGAVVTEYGRQLKDNASYVCETGYRHVGGDTALICGANGTWEGTVIDCEAIDCHDPPTAPHATVKVLNTTYGSTATYTCEAGGAKSQLPVDRTCGDSGTWIGPNISCPIVDCGSPPTLDNTDLLSSGTTLGHTANYSCDVGYEKTGGDDTLTCDTSGTWKGIELTCAVIDCQAPPTVPNTLLTYTDTTYGHSANYTCETGYTSSPGHWTLSCGQDGLWAGSSSTCTVVDCRSPPTLNNTVFLSSGTTLGHTANYSCDLGYEKTRGDDTLTCDTSGTWKGIELTCAVIDCKAPPNLPNSLLAVADTTYGHSANYTCETGYTNSQERWTLLCSQDGQWTGPSSPCEAIDCHSPPTSSHAIISVTNTTYSHSAIYTCEHGYTSPSAPGTLTCGAEGQWLGVVITCSIIDCGNPPPSKNAIVQVAATTFGQTANYSCGLGHKFSSGDKTLTCDSSGRWTGQAITCTEKDCGVPPSNGNSRVNFQTTAYGSQASYTCDSGYEKVEGSELRVCQDDEMWSGQPPTCTLLTCGPPPVFAGAHHWTDKGEGQLVYKDKVHYECFYKEAGREDLEWTLECDINKNWIGQEPQCGSTSPVKPEKFTPAPSEAKWGWALGAGILGVLVSIIAFFVVLDVALLGRHSRFCIANIRSCRKRIAEKIQQKKVNPYNSTPSDKKDNLPDKIITDTSRSELPNSTSWNATVF